MYEIDHIRRQYAVGQGSFHAASVTAQLPGGSYRFDYVYDCGALQNARRSSALDIAIEQYEPRAECRNVGGKVETVTVIDALILSHFDRDHMNGAEDLTLKHSVERIYVPYLSPRELVLEIARQAQTLDERMLADLFGVAHGGTLWGIQVTRIDGSSPDDARERANGDGRFPPFELRPTNESTTGAPASQRLPRAMRAIVDGSDTSVGTTMSAADDLRVEAGGVPCWQLRFWNYAVSDELAYYVAAMLDAIGFPIESLELPDGAKAVANWLASKVNRDAAIDAYLEALRLYAAPWSLAADARHIPNLISLALFSGPWFWDHSHHWDLCYETSPSDHHGWWRFNHSRKIDHCVSWLGTGDAMLGEAEIWQDFERHFKSELPRVRTVLLPHHGAAPANGPAFYNPGLNARPGIMSVISVGSRNRYGHPKDEVTFAVRKHKGVLQVVTEEWGRGFGEFVWGEIFPTP